ncbi:MAG TPA: hypothetical protein PLE43_08330 [Alphaproteobacteria bacterium]|nr:hypothetical protein [Alphaproteobacteria bacterium]
MVYNILLLEDDQGQFDAYQQALSDDGLDSSYNLLHAKNRQEAKNLIQNNTVNAAVLDLKVPEDESSEASVSTGTKYLEELLEEKQFPIIVVSANITSLSDDSDKLPKHLVKMNRETGVHSNAFQHFETIKDLLDISPLFPETLKDINREFQEAFWEMWGNWDEINTRFSALNSDKTKTFLKRYVCSHLIEKWMANDLFNEMHHTEFYTYPPLKDRIHTGDILELDNTPWIVMTAPCNLSNGDYPENLTLLKCQPVEFQQYNDVIKPFRDNLDENKKEKQRKVVKRFFTEPPTSKHYLPPWSKNGKAVNVLFKEIKTVPFAESDRDDLKSKRIATLSYHFLPYLLQRYGAYVSRIGQSEISTEDYITYLLSVVPAPESSS